MPKLVITIDAAGKVALTVESAPARPATRSQRGRGPARPGHTPRAHARVLPAGSHRGTAAFTLRPDGTVVCLYTDAIDLRALGHVHAERASAVEWDDAAQAWRARIFGIGAVLGPFRLRDEAVDAERRALAARLAPLPGRVV